jgi:hypothetical protein
MKVTQHAQARAQQRCIPALMIDLLEQFGAKEAAGNGAVMLFFDKSAKRQLKAYAGPLARSIEEYLDVYLVVSSDDAVVTIGHRQEHIRRH